ncbi:MAG: SEC-C metal-binding domain-containing protein [Candidatus Omnitrophota bacterium]
MEFSARIREDDCDDLDFTYAQDLVESAARHSEPDEARICEWLGSSKVEGEWLEIFLILLAGERKLQAAVPILVDKYKIDTDFMLEQTSEALIKIANPLAVRLIRETFARQSWNFRNYTASFLGRFKREESEQTIIQLLESENDPAIRIILCGSLCDLLSERGMEIVWREIRQGYDVMIATLEEQLGVVAAVLGMELPELANLEQIREQRKQERMQNFQRKISPSVASEPKSVAFDRLPKEKVGRNDPCPCGSGKKYKKCCGKS